MASATSRTRTTGTKGIICSSSTNAWSASVSPKSSSQPDGTFAPADCARAGDLTFAEKETHLAAAEQSQAAAILVSEAFAPSKKVLIRVRNARVAMARVLPLFFPPDQQPSGIHPSAIIDASAQIDPTACIGPDCVLGARVRRWPRAGVRGRLVPLLEPVFDWASEPRVFGPTLLAALASQLLKIWHNVFVLRALGIDLPALCVWYVVPIFGLVSALPVSIGGLGLRETVAGRIAASLGSDSSHLVLFSLAGYVMVVLVNMLGAIPFLFAKRGKRSE